jgi:hypothetical protein
MTKPTIFISHITEEAEIAAIFKKEIEGRFLGLVNVFVSSDATTLKLGKNWLDEITGGLRNCAAMLLFCSPYSIRRPWINFECGAGWARDIEVAPICHSGMRPVDLPLPISLLQGLEANNPDRLREIFQMIAGKLSSSVPDIDASALAQSVKAFESKYTEQNELKLDLMSIKNNSPELLKIMTGLSANITNTIDGYPEQEFISIKSNLTSLEAKSHLKFSYGVSGIGFSTPGGSGGGNFGTLTLALTARTIEICKRI